jgi:hypothetical protein
VTAAEKENYHADRWEAEYVIISWKWCSNPDPAVSICSFPKNMRWTLKKSNILSKRCQMWIMIRKCWKSHRGYIYLSLARDATLF